MTEAKKVLKVNGLRELHDRYCHLACDYDGKCDIMHALEEAHALGRRDYLDAAPSGPPDCDYVRRYGQNGDCHERKAAGDKFSMCPSCRETTPRAQ